MKLNCLNIRNFRRLENVEIDLEDGETVFVGPNNSGKTSATSVFRYFFKKADFRIHDFSVSKIKEIDEYVNADDQEERTFPSIELDLWFKIGNEIEFGRVFALLPALLELDEVGLRISFTLKENDAVNLIAAYEETRALKDEGEARNAFTLSRFLGLEGNLKRYFQLVYFSLEKIEDDIESKTIDPAEAERILASLIRVDFVDAQRNIDDQDASRSNRLSSAFAAFYKHNLDEPELNAEASRVIDENNQSLSAHYQTTFQDLIGVISKLGVPSVNDRALRIVSTLNPEVALKGNTELYYVDSSLNHELPEAYNGLGFKNLIYIAIQVTHYHLQWINTKTARPICHLIFIEEPEVHLHAQVQQTFITNIWNILKEGAKAAGEETLIPQLCVTTHSSHILDAVEFQKVRYFKRCHANGENPEEVSTLNASAVKSLHNFKPEDTSSEDEEDDREETLKFLKQYLKLTHCDLFFADAAILVEGVAEKLFLPKMIEKEAKSLRYCYLSVLEVGGAYAHRFAKLFEFIGIPFVIITDIDSIDPANHRCACQANLPNAKTSNGCLRFFYDKDITVQDLASKSEAEQKLANGNCYLTYQKPVAVEGYTDLMHGRTFEETFIYENLALFSGENTPIAIPLTGNHGADYNTIYELVKSDKFKKAEFALDIIFSDQDWKVPEYIRGGLVWLEGRLKKQLETAQEVLGQ